MESPVPTPSLTSLFEESCDPHGYIPRRASEEVLRCLAQLVRDGEPAVVLHGPSGIGKTMLMHVLAERFAEERRVAHVPLSDAPAPELTHRVLDALAEAAADDPADALVRAASAASHGEPRLLVLIDHADLAPIASSLQLVSAAQSAAPHLTVIFAVADEAGADEFSRAIAANARVTTLRFSQSMDANEATAYVRLRLARADVPAAVRDRLDARAVAWLSEGAQAALPREINRRASELLRSYEEDGEAALHVRIEHEDVRPQEPAPAEPHAVEPGDLPRDDAVEPNPPAFPMTPDGVAPGASGGGGSLGGMLLGSGPGPRPNFEIDLELGRSLSSGLLESQKTKAREPATVRDGQPVAPPPDPAQQSAEEPPPPAHHPSTEPNRSILALAAGVTCLLMLGGFLAVSFSSERETSLEPSPSPQTTQAVEAPLPPATPPATPPARTAGEKELVVPKENAVAATTEPPPSEEKAAVEVARAAPQPPAAEAKRPSLAAGPMAVPVAAREAEPTRAAAPPPAPPEILSI